MTRDQKTTIYLYCEGQNTEKDYFGYFKSAKYDIEVIPGSGLTRMNIVETAIGNFNTKSKTEKVLCEQKWILLDYDGNQGQIDQEFLEAKKLAEENGFRVAYSNMCFEYWLLLHFEDFKQPTMIIGKSHSKWLCTKINEHIKNYNKTHQECPVDLYDPDSKKITQDLFMVFKAIDPKNNKERILNAYERAKAMFESKPGNPYEEPVTNVFLLLEELEIIVPNYYAIVFNKKKKQNEKVDVFPKLDKTGKPTGTFFYHKNNSTNKTKIDESEIMKDRYKFNSSSISQNKLKK